MACVACFSSCHYGQHTNSLLSLFLWPVPQTIKSYLKISKGWLVVLGKGWEMIWFFTTMWGICDLIWTASRESCAKISLHKRTFCAASNFVCQCGEPERQKTFTYVNYLSILWISLNGDLNTYNRTSEIYCRIYFPKYRNYYFFYTKKTGKKKITQLFTNG